MICFGIFFLKFERGKQLDFGDEVFVLKGAFLHQLSLIALLS